MVERFLRYSLQTGRRIRVMILEKDGSASVKNLTVTRMEEGETVFYARAGRGAERPYALSDVLSAGYARGDAQQE